MPRKVTEKNRRLLAEWEAGQVPTNQEYHQVFKGAEAALQGAGFITLIEATRVEQVSLGLQTLIVIELRRIATVLERGRDEST